MNGKLRKYFFNIYWKKNLLFIPLFINFDFLPVSYPGINCLGFPFQYYCNPSSILLGSSYFSIPMFVVNVLFWYAVAGLLIEGVEGLKKINKKTTVLNYITLVIALIFLAGWSFVFKSQAVV
ncbi:MAG: hypothetical protein U9P70_01500 [Patescibacteria group bacterium]|nr:hypothetical protein [Patescibacteria group bacterium]